MDEQDAEVAQLRRQRIVLDEETWDWFVELLDAPVVASPQLRRLLQEPTVFDRS